MEEINAYIKACKAQTNFDLSHEATIAKEKLSLMQDALKGQTANSNLQDQGLVASEVYARVQKLKERESKSQNWLQIYNYVYFFRLFLFMRNTFIAV